jgi:hypothetical protein
MKTISTDTAPASTIQKVAVRNGEILVKSPAFNTKTKMSGIVSNFFPFLTNLDFIIDAESYVLKIILKKSWMQISFYARIELDQHNQDVKLFTFN